MTYTTQTSWKEIMNYLPKAYHLLMLTNQQKNGGTGRATEST